MVQVESENLNNRYNRTAITALVFSILPLLGILYIIITPCNEDGITCLFTGFLLVMVILGGSIISEIIALILGFVAFQKIKKTLEKGKWISIISILIAIAFILYGLVWFTDFFQ